MIGQHQWWPVLYPITVYNTGIDLGFVMARNFLLQCLLQVCSDVRTHVLYSGALHSGHLGTRKDGPDYHMALNFLGA